MKKLIKIVVLVGLLLGLSKVLPAIAKENLHLPKDPGNRGPLGKITFIHYRRAPAKPPWAGGGSDKKERKCYDFLARGAKWETAEPYVINPTNLYDLSDDFVKDAIDAGVNGWEAYSPKDIFDASSLDHNVSYDGDRWDDLNTVSFGPYPQDNVIAVTTVWGYFSGPPQTRELVEWDMLFNEEFVWGDATADTAKMDLQNIATHELGHSAGLADMYNTSCALETMYGYSTEGEIQKRDLYDGDILGITKLYK